MPNSFAISSKAGSEISANPDQKKAKPVPAEVERIRNFLIKSGFRRMTEKEIKGSALIASLPG